MWYLHNVMHDNNYCVPIANECPLLSPPLTPPSSTAAAAGASLTAAAEQLPEMPAGLPLVAVATL